MGSEISKDTLYLCEACMVIESLLMDERILKLETVDVLEAREFLKRMESYFQINDISSYTTDEEKSWKL